MSKQQNISMLTKRSDFFIFNSYQYISTNMVGTHGLKIIIILLILVLKGIKLQVMLVIEIPNGQGRGSMYKRHCTVIETTISDHMDGQIC